jgi:protocatechuate 3,4-dioxygenase beta subunit
MSAASSRTACILMLLLTAYAQQQKPFPAATSEGFSIRGTVVNALSGQILPQAQVMIAPAGGQNEVAQTVITGADGRFEFRGLAPAKYMLLGQRAGFFRQAYDGHWGFSTAIAVGPNLDSENLVFRLRPEASISGTIFDEAGDAVPQSQVMLFRSGMETGTQETVQFQQAMADDEGHYRFSHLPPGRYFVVVTARPWYAQAPMHRKVMFRSTVGQAGDASPEQETETNSEPGRSPLDVAYPTTYYTAATDPSQATAIILNPGDRATADVTLTAIPAVHVRIKNANSQMGMNVEIFQKVFGLEMPLEVQSQSWDGYTEVVSLASGQMVLNFQFGNVPNQNGGGRAMPIDLANDVEIDPAQAPPAASIYGHVTLEGAAALPARMFIQLRSLTSGEELAGKVSPEGDFQIQARYIQPGRYVISTFNNGEAVVRSVTATGAQVSGRVLELAGAGPVQLKISLSHGIGQVKGTAVRDGKLQAGVMVVLVPANYEENPILVRRDQSDSDGTFTLNTVVPGTYTLLAIQNGWDLEWRAPAVLNTYLKNGQTVEVRSGGKYDFKVNVQ